MSIRYFNKKGGKISSADWKKRRTSDNYRIIKQYCNDDILVSAEWQGQADDYFPPSERKIFALLVKNNVNGTWINDISLTEAFATEEAMFKEYELILLKYTECDLVEGDGDLFFEERGNLIEPKPDPEKVSKDLAASEATDKAAASGEWS